MVNFLREKLYDMCSFWEEIYAAIPNGNLIPEFFIKAVKLSVTASLLILVVLALRVVFRKAPRWIYCVLWGLVALRLVCPISLESSFSLVPKSIGSGTMVEQWADYYVGDTWIIEDSSIYYDAAVLNGREPIQAADGSHYVVAAYDQLGAPATVENTVVPILGGIWVIGIVVLLLYYFKSYIWLKRRVATALPLRGNIKQSELIDMSFILGVFRPIIYVPFKIADSDLEYVIAHEQVHIRRGDHWWKSIGFMILAIYWFNPLMWMAYVFLCKDIEMACDEKVIGTLGMEQRQDYSLALLNCSIKQYRIAACPLAFGEVNVKERVKSIMYYKKPAVWLVAAGVITCVVAAVCLLTNQKERGGWESVEDTYRVIENVYEPLWISSMYFPGQNTPYYCFTEDYGTKDYKILESKSDAQNWQELMTEKVEKIKLTKENFDAYFRVLPDAEDSDIWEKETVQALREQNRETWLIDIKEGADDVSGVDAFYCLMKQNNGDVYLAYGLRKVEEYFYEGEKEKTIFRWVFKLEALDLAWVDIETEANQRIMMVPGWYPKGKFDEQIDVPTTVQVNDSCRIEIQLDHKVNVLNLAEHYYAATEQGTEIQKKNYELRPDSNDTFILELKRRNGVQDEQAFYYVETENGMCVFKILFPVETCEEGFVGASKGKETE